MKKILLICFFALSGIAVKAQGIFRTINLAETFFAQLDSGNYAKAHQFFDASVADKIKPESLQALWLQLKQQMGAFEGVDGVQNKMKDDYQLVILNLKFASDNQSFQLAFNKEEKIAGIFLLPKSPSNSHKIPSYADTASYTQKRITIKSGKYELPAMLTVPKDSVNVPLVVFVHGSGPHDMDESIGANKPFQDLALGLASKGIASIRYVKRTLIYPQDFKGAATVKDEVLDDAIAVLNYAKTVPQVDANKLYVFGHSLGGMLAPRIATLDPSVKGLVLAAAPARKLQDLMAEQSKDAYAQSKDTSKVGAKLLAEGIALLNKTKTFTGNTPAQDSLYLGLPTAYWADLNAMDQTAIAKKLPQRILVLQGGHDFQVGETDYLLWQKALKSKRNADFKFYPMLNHLLTFVSEKGDSRQYLMPANVDQTLVDDVASWINQK